MSTRKAATIWSAEATELLIEKMQDFEFLYNIQSAQYLNRAKKIAAYESLTNDVKMYVKDITADEIKKRIQSIRSQYLRELRAVEASKKSGRQDVYMPKLWCYDLLDFLRPYCHKRTNHWRIEEKSSGHSDDEPCSPKGSNPPKKMKCNLQAMVSHRLRAVKDCITKRTTPEYKWLGDLVVFQMANIKSTTIKMKTAWAIQNYLNDALVEDNDPNQRI